MRRTKSVNDLPMHVSKRCRDHAIGSRPFSTTSKESRMNASHERKKDECIGRESNCCVVRTMLAVCVCSPTYPGASRIYREMATANFTTKPPMLRFSIGV